MKREREERQRRRRAGATSGGVAGGCSVGWGCRRVLPTPLPSVGVCMLRERGKRERSACAYLRGCGHRGLAVGRAAYWQRKGHNTGGGASGAPPTIRFSIKPDMQD
ncbi:hypothetical protein CRG98_023168 [Punica granatum]|uniref:Uncharacterized protein n=1 Tax=Punica granatum TaxID=22663 RepID=A0A2I0JKF8_PUNGR|nr:hypothetical protein CRG98_023168 [Punica granatum]